MPPPSRSRYNAKARGHPHKKRKISKGSKKIKNEDSSGGLENPRPESLEIGAPTNVWEPKQPHESTASTAAASPAVFVEPTLVDALHIPKTAAQKEQEKKERMMQEIMEASNSKWNRKRKKKLEAYITKKLKKEERSRIFERLAKTQEEVDHLQLQSSSTLGSAKPMTHLQRLAIAEDQEVRRAVDTRGGRQKRRRGRPMPVADEDLSSGSDSSLNGDISSEMEEDESPWGGIADSDDDQMNDLIPETAPAPASISSPPQVGSALRRNPDGSVITPKTGSGKTTQVPQFLFEAGFGTPGSDNPGIIGITQPRRVAAMSMAARVAEELNLPANRVSYQIRYDATVSERTSIKFMTDGVLLRELSQDFLLTKYSVIIVDEAHERSMNTDILIGVLSRVIRLRDEMWREGKDGVKPLRLIIMSATLRVTDFTENTTLFSTPPPIITVEGRQHSVSIHYNRRTTHDYVNEAVKKASKIHARLPPGGILIFLTGQNEVHDICRKLEKKYGKLVIEGKERLRKEAFGKTGLEGRLKDWIEGKDDGDVITAREGAIEIEELGIESANDTQLDNVNENDPVEKDPEALDTDSEGSGSEEEVEIVVDESNVPMHIVPLYSLLPKEKQMKVFERPPLGSRLVVVATNVAETSITIPGITYVVDAGRAKQRHYDIQTGIESFRVGWISKASGAQRSGRAGRTGPGHCYRLYSSAFYENHFEKFDEPEILRMPIEGVVLQMKAMHIDAVVNFPFPTPPDRQALQKAEQVLIHLGALEQPQSSSKSLVLPLQKPSAKTGAQINGLGRAMALFPVSPRFSKILAIGQQQGCLPYVIAVVAAMSVGDPFLREEAVGIDETREGSPEHERSEGMISEAAFIQDPELQAKEERKAKRRAFFRSQMLHSKLGGGKSDVFKILSAMEEIHKLRAQLSHIVQANFDGIDADFSPKMPPPSNSHLKALRQLITSGFIDRVAVRKDVADKAFATGDKMASCRNIAYRSMEIDEDVFIHPSSVIFHDTPPEWIVFQEVVRTSRVYVKGITVINPSWLPTLGPSFCTYSKPLGLPASMKKLGAELKIVTPRFGPHGWHLPNIKL
ncbi:hypothetical protein M407DRAFT_10632 [Tulasnella calospora MUT 4182]|uniref:RNA helicase n=1 Tax=Tulasnella calospora MUT 4182 TaxID=1051891 RepID=A0A0C3LHP8_9AGAM|nr:hypothetical protein M407DRAFT_10632 [Tulasnella calospora MUT 4182]